MLNFKLWVKPKEGGSYLVLTSNPALSYLAEHNIVPRVGELITLITKCVRVTSVNYGEQDILIYTEEE